MATNSTTLTMTPEQIARADRLRALAFGACSDSARARTAAERAEAAALRAAIEWREYLTSLTQLDKTE
jgi:hypothetical protein